MNLHVLLIQPDTVWEDVDNNLIRCDELIKNYPQKTDLIILPEMFPTGFIVEPGDSCRSSQDHILDWMKMKAREYQALVMGSIPYHDEGHWYNRLFSVRPDGTSQFYDKRHLFTMGEEEKNYCPGQQDILLDFRGWKILPRICYDLRFPVWSRNTSGYDLMVLVANWPAERRKVWNILLPARAIENQAYIAGVNRVGKDGRGIKYQGGSMIVSPYGDIVSLLDDQEGVLGYTLKKNVLARFRKKFPVLNDRDQFELK